MNNDFTAPDGARIMLFDTPCGFEITLMKYPDGGFKMTSYFQGVPVTFTNSQYRLSADGARMLYQKMGELYVAQ